jgi:hypothetical protein
MAVWYGWWSFGRFFPIWLVRTKKNLATLVQRSEINAIEKGMHSFEDEALERYIRLLAD